MSTTILVTYATRYGSTQEVAETIAAELNKLGLSTTLQPMRKVRTLDDYRAIILGAPIYIGRLRKDARSFLARHHDALKAKPVALFALGPTNDAQEDWQNVRQQFEQILAQVAWLKPIATELFGGKFAPAALRFPDSLLTLFPASPLRNMPPSDIRDWTAIRAWVNSLVVQFQPAFA